MRKARFTEEQITYALKQVESGKPVGEVCRQLGVSEQSFYRWKRKSQGIGIAELRRLRQECLEENWFMSLEDAKMKIEAWRKDYNGQRPHSSLGDETPLGFAESWELSRTAKTAGILT